MLHDRAMSVRDEEQKQRPNRDVTTVIGGSLVDRVKDPF